jgi:hypothetical protein
MAVTKASSKTESWTIRVPNDLATAVKAKFPSGTGNTQIVLEAIKHLLDIDPSLPNNTSNNCLAELKLELDEIRYRLAAIEKDISFNRSATISDKPITNAATEGIQLDKLRIFSIAGRTVNKKGIGRKALYQLQ